ncbi:MAG TPA: DivIVA domain-containing protein [Candidatus Aveggerthella excrementigallinarum]|nr:DivIVA domain-containing protein [Candidatus Aveggerthella excrementigallinarum]
MAITSGDIHNQSFSIDRKGYNVDEVDVFLEHVANEIDLLNEQIDQMGQRINELTAAAEQHEAELAAAQEAAASVEHEVAPLPVDATPDEKDERIAELERKLEERKLDDNAIAKALITAQRSGEEVIAKAKADAETMRQDAEEEARRILAKANGEKQRIIESIDSLQKDREDVRAEYSSLLRGFISSATKTLSEIGGDSSAVLSAYGSAYASEDATDTGRVMPRVQAPVREVSSAVATYTTPQVGSAVVTPATPRPSKVEKDLSGYGDADDNFEFEDVE